MIRRLNLWRWGLLANIKRCCVYKVYYLFVCRCKYLNENEFKKKKRSKNKYNNLYITSKIRIGDRVNYNVRIVFQSTKIFSLLNSKTVRMKDT